MKPSQVKMVVLLEGQLLAAGRAAMQSADGVSNAYIAENVTTLGGHQFSTSSFKLSKRINKQEIEEEREREQKRKYKEPKTTHNIANTCSTATLPTQD